MWTLANAMIAGITNTANAYAGDKKRHLETGPQRIHPPTLTHNRYSTYFTA